MARPIALVISLFCKRVDAFDSASLDRPFAGEFGVEFGQRLLLGQDLPLLCPGLPKGFKLAVAETVGICGQIRERPPLVSCLGHALMPEY